MTRPRAILEVSHGAPSLRLRMVLPVINAVSSFVFDLPPRVRVRATFLAAWATVHVLWHLLPKHEYDAVMAAISRSLEEPRP